MSRIGGAIEPSAMRGSDDPVLARHGVPLLAIIGGLNEGIGKIAQLTFIVGQFETRWPCRTAGDGVKAHPVVDVVSHQRGIDLGEIAIGATGQQRQYRQCKEAAAPG